MHLHIAVDIDGTLNLPREEYEFPMCENWLLMNGYSYKKPDYNKFLVKDVFGFDDKRQKEWMDWFFPINCRENPPQLGCPEVMRLLRFDGHKISIVTRRDPAYPGKYTGQEMIRDTEEWLAKNSIPYDEIHYGCKDKVKTLKEINADIMIEDELLNLKPIADAGIACIAIAQPYNKDSDALGPNIVRIDGWPRIKRFIDQYAMIKPQMMEGEKWDGLKKGILSQIK